VAARRPEAADALASELGVTAAPWPVSEPAALVVNATPVGQAGDAEELPLDERLIAGAQVVCDLAYRGDGAETGLVRSARAAGVRAVDGLDVLVGQGARAFQLFTGRDAPLDVMRQAARA
jgi:shikimate dehydrogenase